MYMRIFSGLALPLALAACGGPAGNASSLEEAEAQARSDAASNGSIDCAIGGAGFKRNCTVERETANGELMLTIRHEDGGFRRFKVMKDGSGVVAADGAEPAVVHVVGTSGIEVQVGADKYRLPATVKGSSPARK
jgi:hypothetical protein